ncbi:hypothetical protein QUF74_17700, partial [Candidatus Halobeggiatoa sp. HSG11]|nr:hypothetical protein [Candidatus Halobeggiatoa sp. HSG11]
SCLGTHCLRSSASCVNNDIFYPNSKQSYKRHCVPKQEFGNNNIFFNLNYEQLKKKGIQTSELKEKYEDWKIQEDTKRTYDNYHDRYLLIDSQIEIILTSGFDYLFDKNKEFTYVVGKAID